MARNWYFVTVCTRERRPHFHDGDLVDRLLRILRNASSSQGFDVYAYCFMPDHLHLELAGFSRWCELSVLMREFKGKAARQVRETGLRGLWQKGYYDHVLREGEDEKAVAWYILNNPVRKGLVKDARQWPYCGSWVFDWKRALDPPGKFVPPWKTVAG